MLGGQMALAAAAVAASVTVLSLVLSLREDGPPMRHRNRRWPRIARRSGWLSLAFVAGAVLYLLVLLATGGFSVRYVWQYSAGYEGTLRRLSGLLAGPEGSLLVWALFATIAACWSARRWRRSAAAERRDTAVVHLVVASIACALILVTIAGRPFQSFADAFPSLGGASPVEGRGLNPVLANPWMPPHILLTFAGYTLLGLAFAMGVVQLLRGAQGRAHEALRWRQPGLRAARWAWLLLSAALLTGVVWAYEEMTFGWFWSWDPVESATLAIWLLLTATLHAAGDDSGGRRQLVYTPLLVTASFVGVVFASFVTRSGLHPSVHAFAGGSSGRYLGIGLAGMVGGIALLTVLARRRIPATPPRRPWMFWAAWLLLAGAGLIVLALGYPMAVTGLLGRSVDMDGGFFTMWGYLVAVGLLLLMGFGLQAAQGRRRDATVMLGLFMAMTGIAALIKPVMALGLMSAERRAAAGAVESFLGGASVLSLLPPAVYALMAIVERWRSSRRDPSRRRSLLNVGSAAIHVGVVAAVLGATFATVLSSSVTVGVDPATGTGVAGGVMVRVTDLQRTQHLDGVGTLVEDRETAVLEVRADDLVLASGIATVSTYPERAMGRHAGMLISRGLFSDVQVIYHGIADIRPDGVPVTIRRIPLIGLLWAGLALMVGGLAATIAARLPQAERVAVAGAAGGRR